VTTVLAPPAGPNYDLGDPGAARAPVHGSLVAPVPSLQQLCGGGYVKKTTPPPAVTDPIKTAQLARGNYADRNPAHYVEDQLIPVERGGAPADERNLWPQVIDLANLKNREENRLRAGVCAHSMTLAAAQAQIVRDWGPLPTG